MIDLKINNIMKVKIEAPLTKRLDKMLEKAIEWTRDLMIYHEGIIFLHEKGDDPNLLYNMPSVFCRIKQGKVVQYTIIGLLEHNEELYLLPWMKDGSKSKIPASEVPQSQLLWILEFLKTKIDAVENYNSKTLVSDRSYPLNIEII